MGKQLKIAEAVVTDAVERGTYDHQFWLKSESGKVWELQEISQEDGRLRTIKRIPVAKVDKAIAADSEKQRMALQAIAKL